MQTMVKKAQFKIQQMAFMLVAVFLFFILVALFWLGIQYRNINKQAIFLESEKAGFMSDFLSSSSEFSCTREQGEPCIDTDKIMALKDRSMYKEFWPVAFITVRKLDGKPEEKECTNENYPDCNIYKVYENNKIEYKGSGIGSYTALCRYEKISGYPTKICDIGKLIIGYETN